MDPLSHIVALLRPHAVFSKPITGRGSWGVSYDPYEAPSFCIVLSGRCWLSVENTTPRLLDCGDFLLIPVTPAFSLCSEPGAYCHPCRPSETGVRHGDSEGEPDFRMLGGAFKVEPVNATLLLGLLPEMIHIRSVEGDTSRLARIIDLIKDECADERQGRTMILERLLEVLLIESLRWSATSQESIPAGLLAGMRDPAIAGALRAMHSDVLMSGSICLGQSPPPPPPPPPPPAKPVKVVGNAEVFYFKETNRSRVNSNFTLLGSVKNILREDVFQVTASFTVLGTKITRPHAINLMLYSYTHGTDYRYKDDHQVELLIDGKLIGSGLAMPEFHAIDPRGDVTEYYNIGMPFEVLAKILDAKS